MKKLLLILSISILTISAKSQLSLQYTNTRQAPASHNMTVLDNAADVSGNLYFIYSDDPAKIILLTKVNAGGNTLWTDTVAVANYPLVNVINAKISIGQNKIYVLYGGYGNPGPAGAIVAVYDFNGNYLNGFNASSLTNIWSYGMHGVYEKSNGNIVVYYSYGDQLPLNDTMYVKEFTQAFNQVWVNKYFVPKLVTHCPAAMDAAGNFYFVYTNDSIAGASHYLKSYTRKLNNNGSTVWTNMSENVAYKSIKKMYNGDIAIAGNNNPNGSILGNNTGDIKTVRLADANGDTVWTRTYNGAANEREEVNGIEVDQLNNIYVVGAEDIHDYSPFVNKGFLKKYTSTGTLDFDKKLSGVSTTIGVYLNALANLHTISYTGNNTLQIKYIMATTGNTFDSLTTNINYASGLTLSCHNPDDDIFVTYSEGHCGANHLEALRYCTKAVCNNPDGIEDRDDKSKVVIYPNPAYGELHFTNPENRKFTIIITDILGKKRVYDEAQSKSQAIINIRNLTTGYYLLTLKDKESVYTFKFFKE